MDASWIDRWSGKRICVVGDVMLDRFVYGHVERVSPEAPIPILRHESEKCMLGGAANVARNIVGLGGEVSLIGVLGRDGEGDIVADRLCAADGITGHFVRLDGHPTTVKTRYVSGGQQILRLDVETVLTPDDAVAAALVDRFEQVVHRVDAVVLSDYAKGVLSPAVIAGIVAAAKARGVPVVVDPKTRDVARYADASVLTPNASEAAMIAGIACTDDAAAETAAKRVRDLARVDAVVLTRGAQGMTIFAPAEDAERAVSIPTHASEVFDVSGAGDTVVATMTLALAAGAAVTTAARIANVAAGIAVGKRGTAVVRAQELAKALGGGAGGDPKVVSNEEAAAIVADWKAHGLEVGFTNGCFDLLHPGHVELLKKSRAACDRLVVALNTDASVRRLKGPTRPVQNEHARSVVMAAIDSVDLVTLFGEDTPLELIERLKPDVLIKGADYTVETVVGSSFVLAHGGRVALVPLEVGHSTTSIIARANTGESE